jgi:hypothetical protein
MKRVVIILLSIVLAFCAGYALGSRGLHDCQQRNKIMHDDLVFAVSRGLTAETNLGICKELRNKEQRNVH